MRTTIAHALVLKTNIVSPYMYLEVAIEGIEFPEKTVPKNYPNVAMYDVCGLTVPLATVDKLQVASIISGSKIDIGVTIDSEEELGWKVVYIKRTAPKPALSEVLDYHRHQS